MDIYDLLDRFFRSTLNSDFGNTALAHRSASAFETAECGELTAENITERLNTDSDLSLVELTKTAPELPVSNGINEPSAPVFQEQIYSFTDFPQSGKIIEKESQKDSFNGVSADLPQISFLESDSPSYVSENNFSDAAGQALPLAREIMVSSSEIPQSRYSSEKPSPFWEQTSESAVGHTFYAGESNALTRKADSVTAALDDRRPEADLYGYAVDLTKALPTETKKQFEDHLAITDLGKSHSIHHISAFPSGDSHILSAEKITDPINPQALNQAYFPNPSQNVILMAAAEKARYAEAENSRSGTSEAALVSNAEALEIPASTQTKTAVFSSAALTSCQNSEAIPRLGYGLYSQTNRETEPAVLETGNIGSGYTQPDNSQLIFSSSELKAETLSANAAKGLNTVYPPEAVSQYEAETSFPMQPVYPDISQSAQPPNIPEASPDNISQREITEIRETGGNTASQNTSEIHIDMSNMSNTITNETDIDEVISAITDAVAEASMIISERA
ncbi:MAG: hypothetical protein HDT46_04855 [Ruminococcaceae bacterium]|nr:hypothetical protein [Oscillospiraceae bacterium]